MLATEVSIARMISAMRRMFVCVSVIRIALLPSFELIVAVSGSSGLRFSTSFAASPKRSGRICVTISSLRGIFSGSLPVCTGRSRFCASLRLTIFRMRLLRMATKPFSMSTVLSRSTASSGLIGWRLITFTVPLTCASCTITKPAASLR